MRILHFSKLRPGNNYIEIMTLEAKISKRIDSIGINYLIVEKEYDNIIMGTGDPRSFVGVYINDYKEPLTGAVGECVFHLEDMGNFISEAREAIKIVLEYEL